MAETTPPRTTPPPLETKDLPHAAVPAPVPFTDRIGYEAESDENADTAGDESESTTRKTARKSTEPKG
jgi:hypothetical protein